MLHIQSKDCATQRHGPLLRKGSIALLVAACAGLAILLAAGCSGIMGSAANKVYPSLAQPEEIEAPPTFTTYLPSTATQAILGGRGQGLNCSIPPLLARLAFESGGNESDVSLRFRQACAMHDMCYRHGYATYRYTQADCDTMLQQSAFRLCRQIYGARPGAAASRRSDHQGQDDVSKVWKEGLGAAAHRVYASCETEAKKVLLGVTLGGGGSYLAADRSTYFEYDPMPIRADDYVVGRAVSAAGEQPDKDDIGIRTFYFRRNTVEMAMLTSPAPGAGLEIVRAAPVLFPQRLIPTPPIFGSREVSTEPFLALARDSFGNTSLTVVRFQTQASGSGDDPKPALSLFGCAAGSDRPCRIDADASVQKLAVVDGRPVLLLLTHRGRLDSPLAAGGEGGTTVTIVQKSLSGLGVGRTEEETLTAEGGITCRAGTFRATGSNGKSKCVMSDYPLNGSSLISDKYRFLQHDILLEQGVAGNATHAWVLARGAALDSAAAGFVVTETSGEDYKSRLVAVRQALGNGKNGETQRFGLEVEEADEPLSLVRMGDATGAALIGLAWAKDDLDRVGGGKQPLSAPILKLWKMPVPGRSPDSRPKEIALPQALKERFLSVPPTIVRLVGIDPPLLVFVRVDDPLTQDGQVAAGKAEAVRIKFHVVPLDDAGLAVGELKTAGEFSCVIDLEKQARLPAASQIRTRALRALAMRSEDEGRSEISLTPAVRERVFRDLSYRWRMGQFIASERRAGDGSGLLALTMVFNGFPALSTQMLLRPSGDGLSFSQEGGCVGGA